MPLRRKVSRRRQSGYGGSLNYVRINITRKNEVRRNERVTLLSRVFRISLRALSVNRRKVVNNFKRMSRTTMRIIPTTRGTRRKCNNRGQLKGKSRSLNRGLRQINTIGRNNFLGLFKGNDGRIRRRSSVRSKRNSQRGRNPSNVRRTMKFSGRRNKSRTTIRGRNGGRRIYVSITTPRLYINFKRKVDRRCSRRGISSRNRRGPLRQSRRKIPRLKIL